MGRGRGSGIPCAWAKPWTQSSRPQTRWEVSRIILPGEEGLWPGHPVRPSGSEGLVGGQHGRRDTGNRPRGQPQALLNGAAPQARKDKGGLGRGSTQQKGHLWQVQLPATPSPLPPSPGV